MNRARLQQQRAWIQQRVNSGGRSFSPWDALELLDALLGEEQIPANLEPGPIEVARPIEVTRLPHEPDQCPTCRWWAARLELPENWSA